MVIYANRETGTVQGEFAERLLASALTNKAGTLVEAGHPDDAMRRYEEVLRVQQKDFGDEHPETASTLNNMAGVFKQQGKYKEAMQRYEEVLWVH
uniref:Uncharacterized protein n=1 Tax=Chromera velia CCMP2878 TaxID=1169474 RepID=A0A0G4GA41_9ALVE|eukprot:Cvel_20834.t1-p1 / transcript=Cvel_20834.t1 / gene=Cvel_20834 / organism=Chromera_velia_CCMP2878 / gene_product=Kinesin light chain, putative / transcript_product=Kinesin light chain, putative / location=Cvel_scaffold1906:6918-7199(+) / protein_length=94 / sequence_SO=supercontig / SO=protein_coding / is_pseudo=false